MTIGEPCFLYFDRFRMVVIETKMQILEVDGHETAVAQNSNIHSPFNNSKYICSSFIHCFLNEKKAVKT